MAKRPNQMQDDGDQDVPDFKKTKAKKGQKGKQSPFAKKGKGGQAFKAALKA